MRRLRVRADPDAEEGGGDLMPNSKKPAAGGQPESTPRTRDGRWVAGGPSPNPGGRKSDKELTELARVRAPEAIDALARIAAGKGLAAVRAAEVILDRALGRPKQSMSVEARRMPDAAGFEAFQAGVVDLLQQANAEVEAAQLDSESGEPAETPSESGNDIRTLPPIGADGEGAGGQNVVSSDPDGEVES